MAPSARRIAAYFTMVNDHGGINGRKIDFISRDDGYSPPKTVEQVRRLVEEDQVLAMFQTLGTPPNLAIRGYLNDNKVPQLFVGSGADQWNDPEHYPWTMGWQPSYRRRGAHLRPLHPAEAAQRQSRRALSERRFRQGLSRSACAAASATRRDKMIVATQSYETTDPTVDSQIVALHGSGADVLLIAAIPKFTTLAIRKVYDIGWRPIAIPQFGVDVGRDGA